MKETAADKFRRKAREADAARKRRMVESVRFFLDDRARMSNAQSQGGQFALELLAGAIVAITNADTKERRELAARIIREYSEVPAGISEETRRELERIVQKAMWYLMVVNTYPARLTELRDRVANLKAADIGAMPPKEYARILWFEIDRTTPREGWADHFADSIALMEKDLKARLDRDLARIERDREAFMASHTIGN